MKGWINLCYNSISWNSSSALVGRKNKINQFTVAKHFANEISPFWKDFSFSFCILAQSTFTHWNWSSFANSNQMYKSIHNPNELKELQQGVGGKGGGEVPDDAFHSSKVLLVLTSLYLFATVVCWEKGQMLIPNQFQLHCNTI